MLFSVSLSEFHPSALDTVTLLTPQTFASLSTYPRFKIIRFFFAISKIFINFAENYRNCNIKDT